MHNKPVLFVEWSNQNLPAYGFERGDLLHLCADMDYSVHMLPNLSRIDTKPMLDMAMAQTETFALVPMRPNRHNGALKVRAGLEISQVS